MHIIASSPTPHSSYPRPFLAITLLVCLLVSACGGGGGAGGPDEAAMASAEMNAQTQRIGARPISPPGSVTVNTNGWSAWTKTLTPVFAGPYNLIGDPSVIRDGTTLRMAYNCYDPIRHD